jgi:sporulation protein YabP
METITIEDRTFLTLKGATRMISSTETQSVVEVGDCNVVVSGQNLEITKLDLENKEVTLKGRINSLKYAQKTEKTNLIKRLFK